MSPLSPGGFGRQLAASNAVMRAAVARNGTLREVVFLMKPLRPPDFSGQTKKPLPLNPDYRGLHRLYHRVAARGNRVNLLCGPLRISAFSALMSYFNAETTEIR